MKLYIVLGLFFIVGWVLYRMRRKPSLETVLKELDGALSKIEPTSKTTTKDLKHWFIVFSHIHTTDGKETVTITVARKNSVVDVSNLKFVVDIGGSPPSGTATIYETKPNACVWVFVFRRSPSQAGASLSVRRVVDTASES